MNKLTAEKCRAQFETWFSEAFPVIHRMFERSGEGYYLPSTDAVWKSWQASRAALEIAQPVLEKGGWIKHEGNNRPLGLRKHDLVYLNLKKQPIRIPYPAGMVNWKQTGSDFDVMEWKRAEGELPQADAYSQQEQASGKHQEGE